MFQLSTFVSMVIAAARAYLYVKMFDSTFHALVLMVLNMNSIPAAEYLIQLL